MRHICRGCLHAAPCYATRGSEQSLEFGDHHWSLRWCWRDNDFIRGMGVAQRGRCYDPRTGDYETNRDVHLLVRILPHGVSDQAGK